jgi:hypothetical protein
MTQTNSIEHEIFNSAFFCSYLLYSAGVAALNPFGVKSYLVLGQCMNENVCNWTYTDSWSFVVFRGFTSKKAGICGGCQDFAVFRSNGYTFQIDF